MYSQDITVDEQLLMAPEQDPLTQSGNNEPDVVLNLGAAQCPMLGLKSMKALRRLEPGQTIELSTAGEGAGKAIKRVAWMTKTTLIGTREKDGQFVHVLQKD